MKKLGLLDGDKSNTSNGSNYVTAHREEATIDQGKGARMIMSSNNVTASLLGAELSLGLSTDNDKG